MARTRLREEGTKYRSFWQTLATVAQEEGYRGVYRGLSTQLIRQIPNTAIMMATYEAVVYALTKYFGSPATEFYIAEESSTSNVTNNGDMIISRPVEEHDLSQ